MKYTRYDLKAKSESKTFIFMILLILIFAFFFGTVIFKIFAGSSGNAKDQSNNSNVQINDQTKENSVNSISKDKKTIKFIAVQGGIYKDKNNVEQEKNVLKPYCIPFLVTEQDKTRVLIGVYAEETGEKIIKSLTEQKIDNSKIVFYINNDDTCNAQIAELINAYVQVLNKLSEKNVEAVKTSELKKWTNSLEKIERGSNLKSLNEIKSYINKLPDKISKNNVGENYVYIYNFLRKVSKK